MLYAITLQKYKLFAKCSIVALINLAEGRVGERLFLVLCVSLLVQELNA